MVNNPGTVLPEEEIKTLRILVVEDNPGDFIIIRELLKASGTKFSLSNATSLNESLLLISSNHYDVVIVDLGLPDSMGLNTVRELLNNDVPQPVIVMTGLDDEEVALASLREGAQDYLVKNRLDSENILRSIKYSIERKTLENLQKKNSQQLAILSETTAALFEGNDISDVYVSICKSVRNLIKNSKVLTFEINKNATFRISNYDQIVAKLNYFDFENLNFRISDQPGKLFDFMYNRSLQLGDMKNLKYLKSTNDIIINVKEISMLLDCNYFYAIGILRDEMHYGGLVILSTHKIEDDDKQYIENICSQAALSIHRRIISKNLVESESKYQKLAEELEIKVKERTLELEAKNTQLRDSEVRLRELNATKDKFFNIVAHDLKNPFTSLLGATELLFHNIQNMDKEKIRKLAQILNESAKSGYSILLNLLDWSRSQTGTIKINLQRIDLKSLIDENIADIHLNCVDKEISVIPKYSDYMNITADKNMLNTVLRNLLSNAIKFTPRGGTIIVTTETRKDEVLVSVSDNGIGISSEHINKLFRIDSKYSRPGTEKELGTGLGLKLSREFVEKLGGKIWVESTEGKGSTFTFSIPLLPEVVVRS